MGPGSRLQHQPLHNGERYRSLALLAPAVAFEPAPAMTPRVRATLIYAGGGCCTGFCYRAQRQAR